MQASYFQALMEKKDKQDWKVLILRWSLHAKEIVGLQEIGASKDYLGIRAAMQSTVLQVLWAMKGFQATKGLLAQMESKDSLGLPVGRAMMPR